MLTNSKSLPQDYMTWRKKFWALPKLLKGTEVSEWKYPPYSLKAMTSAYFPQFFTVVHFIYVENDSILPSAEPIVCLGSSIYSQKSLSRHLLHFANLPSITTNETQAQCLPLDHRQFLRSHNSTAELDKWKDFCWHVSASAVPKLVEQLPMCSMLKEAEELSIIITEKPLCYPTFETSVPVLQLWDLQNLFLFGLKHEFPVIC